MEEDEGESRDWAEMPSDALSAVLAKLDVADLFTAAGLVCRAWRRLVDSDTTLWRHVDMSHHGDLLETEEAEAMARAAVDHAAGTMEAFWADTFVTDGLLRYISESLGQTVKQQIRDNMYIGIVKVCYPRGNLAFTLQGKRPLKKKTRLVSSKLSSDDDLLAAKCRASLLKSLQLSLCYKVSNEGLAEAIKGFPQLEELDITFCSLYGNVCELVGKACPRLKCFRLNERFNVVERGFAAYDGWNDDAEAFGIANSMPELRDLQLIGNDLTNNGLMAIIDHCPHLASLDIRQCFNLQIDDAMKSKCARITNLKLPDDPISDFKYRAYITSSMYDDLLDVVTDDDESDDMDDFDDAGSESGMYDDIFGI